MLAAAQEEMLPLSAPSSVCTEEEIFSLAALSAVALETHVGANTVKKPHQGVARQNRAPHLEHEVCNSTTALRVSWSWWSGTASGAGVTYDYDAFGNIVNQTGTTPNNYQFAGEQYDPALGVYYNRTRYLNSTTGRFVTQDDDNNGNIGDPRSLHLYLYANGDPVNRTDPNGQQAAIAELGAELAALFVLTAITIISLKAIKAQIEIPFRANHYTQWKFVLSILASGLDRDRNYVTTDWYFTGTQAQAKLALSRKPQVMIDFFVYKNRDDLVGPNEVAGARDASGVWQPGGGSEYYSDFPIPVATRMPVILPLF